MKSTNWQPIPILAFSFRRCFYQEYEISVPLINNSFTYSLGANRTSCHCLICINVITLLRYTKEPQENLLDMSLLITQISSKIKYQTKRGRDSNQTSSKLFYDPRMEVVQISNYLSRSVWSHLLPTNLGYQRTTNIYFHWLKMLWVSRKRLSLWMPIEIFSMVKSQLKIAFDLWQ